nr:biotin--[acetyl-CoA-carboxylase] ligase [Corynebacterium lactis]
MTDPRIVSSRQPVDEQALRTLAPGWNSIEVLDKTGSTNADLKAKVAAAGAESGDVPDRSAVFASAQSSGRGRLARKWEAPYGSSIALSVLFKPGTITPQQLGLLPLVVGLSVVDMLVGVAELDSGRVQLKWPNDVLVDGRKICGILVEAASIAPPILIPGIGINVSMTQEELPVPHATSLLLAGARNLDRTELVAGLLRALDNRERQWLREDPALLSDYRDSCATIGSRVRVELPGDNKLEGVAVGIREDGELIVTDNLGTSHFVAAGDVFHVRAADGGYAGGNNSADAGESEAGK